VVEGTEQPRQFDSRRYTNVYNSPPIAAVRSGLACCPQVLEDRRPVDWILAEWLPSFGDA